MRLPNYLESLLIRTAASAYSHSGRNASLLVLIYHRVLAEPDALLPDEPDAARFAAEIDLLRTCFTVLPLAEAVRRLRAGILPSRAACITFDDGYANNCEIALPILASRGVPATVFVAPGFLDGGRMFNDTVIEIVRRAPPEFDLRDEGLGRYSPVDAASRRKVVGEVLGQLKYLEPAERLRRIQRIADLTQASLPNDLMMTSAQVRELHGAGIEIGAHTVDHPILTSVDDVTARQQISASKAVLEAIIDAPVRSFAYPNGRPTRDYAGRHAAMVREAGFDLAVSTAWGVSDAAADVFQIPRISPVGHSPARYGLRLARVFGDRTPEVAS
jgi:peptidoglycan/xylan/chitin deacetylase (PgdA/CDA1 family)